MKARPAATVRGRPARTSRRALWRAGLPSTLGLLLVAALVLVWLASGAGTAQGGKF